MLERKFFYCGCLPLFKVLLLAILEICCTHGACDSFQCVFFMCFFVFVKQKKKESKSMYNKKKLWCLVAAINCVGAAFWTTVALPFRPEPGKLQISGFNGACAMNIINITAASKNWPRNYSEICHTKSKIKRDDTIPGMWK